jgi:hypothetical protein
MAETILSTFKGKNGQIDLFEDKIIIKRNGIGAFLANMGSSISKGDKSIFLDQIRAIEIKKAFLSGEIFFNIGDSSLLGSLEGSTARAETTVEYAGSDHKKALEMKEKIESSMSKMKKSASSIQPISQADELKKFKELLDQGVLTQGEFDRKKKEILGL